VWVGVGGCGWVWVGVGECGWVWRPHGLSAPVESKASGQRAGRGECEWSAEKGECVIRRQGCLWGNSLAVKASGRNGAVLKTPSRPGGWEWIPGRWLTPGECRMG
jgi:hypothetical protein